MCVWQTQLAPRKYLRYVLSRDLLVKYNQTIMGCQCVPFSRNQDNRLLSVLGAPFVASNFLVWVDAQPEDVLPVPLLSRIPPLARRIFFKILQPQQPRKTRESGKVFVKLNQNLCICTITMYSECRCVLTAVAGFLQHNAKKVWSSRRQSSGNCFFRR